MSRKDFCPDVKDAAARVALVSGFFAAHGVSGGDPARVAEKERMLKEKQKL